MSDFSNTMTSEAAKRTLAGIDARLVPPAVLGYRCCPIDDDDENGVWCGEGSINSYDGALHWYVRPPGEVLRPTGTRAPSEPSGTGHSGTRDA